MFSLFRCVFPVISSLSLAVARAQTSQPLNNEPPLCSRLEGLDRFIKIRAEMPMDLSPQEKERLYIALHERKPPELSKEDKNRYERGIALNKAIAFYGLRTLSHYKAKIVSIKPSPRGIGLEIELQTKSALIHKSGKPWYAFEQHLISPRLLRWYWPNVRPVPASVGLWVDAYADGKDDVQRISINQSICGQDRSVVALRRATPSGLWEFCYEFSIDGKNIYLLIQPDYVNLFGEEIEWTTKYGLAVSRFVFAEPSIGGSSDIEQEIRDSKGPGWPVANSRGGHVVPGRDGWKTGGFGLGQAMSQCENSIPTEACMLRVINPGQYIESCNGWDVLRPLSP